MDENTKRGTSDSRRVGDRSGLATGERPIFSERILSAVADEHRRAVLRSLDSAPEGTREYEALGAEVAERVRDESAGGSSGDHRQRVRIELHHTHLPKLEAARLIDYDSDTGHVEFVGTELDRDVLALVGSIDVDE